MSKSKGNVVDPLDIVEEYGADTLRTYVLFMGDYGAATPWSENSVKGLSLIHIFTVKIIISVFIAILINNAS